MSSYLSMPDASVWTEVVRAVVMLLYVSGLVTVFVIAIKSFAGPRAKSAPSWHLRFALIGVPTLVALLVVQEPVEAFLGAIAEPLARAMAPTAPGWPRDALIGIFRSSVTTLGLVLLIQLIGRLYWRWEGKLQKWRDEEEGTRAYWMTFGTATLRFFRVGAIFSLLLASLPLYLNYFPRSRVVVAAVSDYLGAPATTIAAAVLAYLPNLGYLILILLLGRYCLRAIRYVFYSLDSGALQIRGFHRDWAIPSYKLARTLFLVFLLMVSYPYLPGAKSEFFQGFSVFVGALITFGSSGAIGNIVAGTMLTYTRAFRIGDMVKMGDFTGVVIERTLLVTRIRTAKNEEVAIPNGNVLSGSVLNYTARAASEGVVLTVSAGIGYDVDWRTVHRLMIEGALATEHILRDPAPAVWQSSLGDYAVNYELRAATSNTTVMWETYSILRQNVLDSFNHAGVEIMTPSILAHRDASSLAVPSEQFSDRSRPGISVEVKAQSASGGVAAAHS